MIKKSSYIFVICFAVFLSIAFSNSRVGFSRPGAVIRTPGNINLDHFNQYIVVYSAEISNFSDLNYASSAYFHGVSKEGFYYGLSYTTPMARSLETVGDYVGSQAGVHLHKNIFTRDNMRITVGVHDVLYESNQNHRLSLFSSFSHSYTINTNFHLETTLGFGTGYIAKDSHDYNEGNTNEGANFFTGFKLHTPYLLDNGGLKLLAEYDGWGINLGASIPITQAWTINIGLSHLENIQNINDWNSVNVLDGNGDVIGTSNYILGDAPALLFGFQMNIPNLSYPKPTSKISNWSTSYNFNNNDEVIDSLVFHADNIINALEDSLMLLNADKTTLNNLNIELTQKINTLVDSLNSKDLTQKVYNQNLNEALKTLSLSLSEYYNNNYRKALELVSQAIEQMPDLALAYARKGSIYYKLGDIQRATVNWNIALKLDPEYNEVRSVLLAIKNNEQIILPE